MVNKLKMFTDKPLPTTNKPVRIGYSSGRVCNVNMQVMFSMHVSTFYVPIAPLKQIADLV